MQHKRGNFKTYIHRIFRQKAAAAEKETFARWFTQLDLSDNVLADGEEDAIKERVRLALQNHAFNTQPKGIVHFPFWLRSVAATILVCIGVGLYFFLKHPKPEPQVAYQEVHTIRGERKTITLADGTAIQLNNESSLKYPENFSGKTREVYLSGEAFFTVVHNKTKPFLVHIDKLNVQVLGTSFDVKGYREDKNISVVVATGKVGVNKSGQQAAFMLLPGDRLFYNMGNGQITQKKVDPQDYIAWQRGELIFQDENMESICHRLERWYGVDVHIQNRSLLTKKLSLKIKGDDFSSVIRMLSLVGDFKYEIKDKAVVVIR